MGEKSFIKKLAARQKAKGLQRLRWYCQMCQKQCRDENGFQNHTNSESHRRQLSLFAENPHSFISDFSNTLLTQFLDILRTRFGTSPVKANAVYQEYIKDKNHVHMNATRWTTLTGLVAHMGKAGLVRVEEREGEGLFIAYIDKEVAERKKRARMMEQERFDEEDRKERAIRKLRREAEEEEDGPTTDNVEEKMLRRDDGDEAITLSIRRKVANSEGTVVSARKSIFDSQSSVGSVKKRPRMETKSAGTDPSEKPKESHPTTVPETWLAKGIAVKIMNKDVGEGSYYKKKGTVTEIAVTSSGTSRAATATIEMNDSGDVLRVTEDWLETVIPHPDGIVLVLRGQYRGHEAKVLRLELDRYRVVAEVLSGPGRRKSAEFPYEDVSKLNREAT